MNHQEQTKKLQAEILRVIDYIQAAQELCDRLRLEVEQLTVDLREKKKAVALNPSPGSKEAIDITEKRLTMVTNELSGAKTLTEALSDRKELLQAEYEVSILETKASGLIDTFNNHIQIARQELFRRKMHRDITDNIN